eukprot:gene17285-23473_t
MNLDKRAFLQVTAAAALVSQTGLSAAQDKKFKIGLLLPMTGPFASTGRQIENGVRLYMAQFGTKVAGRE